MKKAKTKEKNNSELLGSINSSTDEKSTIQEVYILENSTAPIDDFCSESRIRMLDMEQRAKLTSPFKINSLNTPGSPSTFQKNLEASSTEKKTLSSHDRIVAQETYWQTQKQIIQKAKEEFPEFGLVIKKRF